MVRTNTHPLHFAYVLLLIGVLSIYVGCSGGTASNGNGPADYRFGSEALDMRWDPTNERVFYEGDDLALFVDVNNRGTDELYAELFLSGYDPNFLQLQIYPSNFISIQGKDEYDPNGDFGDQISIVANHVRLPRNTERFTQAVKLTACYDYKTRASAEVCVDPDPQNRFEDNKVCQLSASAPGGQGHPVVITSIVPHVSRNDIRFTIEFSNSGTGDVFDRATSSYDCASGLTHSQVDRVYVESVRLSGMSLSCEPLNPVRMRNGVGTISCECTNCIDQSQGAYKSLIEMELGYGYRNTISTQIELVSTQ